LSRRIGPNASAGNAEERIQLFAIAPIGKSVAIARTVTSGHVICEMWRSWVVWQKNARPAVDTFT
jgi:hypothetical protein